MSSEMTNLQSKFDNISPLSIFPPSERNPDPAIERSVDLFDLVTLLERIKNRNISRTLLFGIHAYSTENKHFPSKEVVIDVIKHTKTIFAVESEDHPPYYDVIGISYWDPDSFNNIVLPGTPIYTGESPFHTLYPAPAFLNGVFGLGDYSINERFSLIKFFLANNYIDRAIILPRLRYRSGTLYPEMVQALQTLIPEAEDDQEMKGIIKRESIFDLPTVPDSELVSVGIPVIRMENEELVIT